MKVTTITFSLGRSIPLQALSGDPADQYASARPTATVTIDLTKDDADPATGEGKLVIDTAFQYAAEMTFERMKDFHDDLRQVYKDAEEARKRKVVQKSSDNR